MKHTFRYLLTTVVLMIPVLALAQDPEIYKDYQVKNGVATAKRISETPNADGTFTLTLETFATGLKSIVQKSIPSDIVLVLDYSSSMLMNGSVGRNPDNDWYSGTGSDGLPNVRDYLYSLKVAVGDFVKLLQQNNESLQLAPGQMGNRIAFILYANEVYGDDPTRNVSGNGNFYAEELGKFILVDDMSVVSKTERHPLYSNAHQLVYNSAGVMYNAKDILSPSSYRGVGNAGYNGINAAWDMGDVNKGTATGDALEAAYNLVKSNTTTYPYTERSTTVVLFTDGEPSRIGNSGFYQTEAQKAVREAYFIKTANVNPTTEATGTPNTADDADSHVKMFSVGLLTSPSNQMKTFLEYVSSDFSLDPPAENTNSSNPYNMPTSGYLTASASYGPYSSIVSQGADLSRVFQTIASSSGGSTSTIPTQTQLVDIVSNSFSVPSTTTINDITVYTRTVSADGKTWGEAEPVTKQLVSAGDNPPMTVQQPDAGKIGIVLNSGNLTVVGFDYSKADQEGEDGSAQHPYTGNWVGFRGDVCAGREVVIEFNIKPDPNATGGDGTSTNKKDSGVYVPIFSETDPTVITGYQNINSYEIQHADLPVNLVITKTGLRHGESATIQIYRAKQKKVNGVVQYHPDTGKPLPNADPDVPGSAGGWENFSKVILTNLGDDGATVTKTLLCLHADYVYLLAEDNWGWAYELDDHIMNTSEVEKNPFEFTNEEKTDAVKHAEAVTVNHFGSHPYVEKGKSSKGSFFSPTNN